MFRHLEPPGRKDCPSVCQASPAGQRFRIYSADSHRPARAKCTVQNARPCNLHGTTLPEATSRP
ncbi:hypothetical protein EGJ09_16175 [Pseudomonas sp. p106]|nr:hypothetical protein EGJ09_16175 [Pseudomonas sp. p106]